MKSGHVKIKTENKLDRQVQYWKKEEGKGMKSKKEYVEEAERVWNKAKKDQSLW